ncbi:hypothetical protein LTR56_003983 [Elasticomyces elasticus]|nr:hypothetical protein LTR56_003983 [Elasticomyces elasticus]KAK4928849.1 hypothetical protein LTR49_004350 [Elasticomyces elasticus]
MAPSPPTSITLTVKVPPGHLEGGADHFPLGSVDVSSTIGAIRQQIQSVVPSHPSPEKQRLLYGGRALVDNEQTLADALNTKRDSTQTEYVIHLLVKGEGHGNIGAPVAGETVQGHQRAVHTPAQQQQQLMEERQQSMRNAMLEGQQQQRAQMAQMNLGMGMPMQPGLMPPNPFAGLQQFPGVQMGGMPQQMMGHNFNQAVAQNQQQRAAMGMHGVGQQALPQQDGTAATQPQAEGQQPGAQATVPQPLTVNGQPVQQQQQLPQGLPRPVSGQGFHFEGIGPNGERVQIHQQVQAFQLPLNGLMPQFAGFPAQPQMPFGVAQQQQLPGQGQGQQPSALDRARDNMTEMRRMLDEMRDAGAANEEHRGRIERLRERVQGVNDYIDPFNVHGAANATNGGTGPSIPHQTGTIPGNAPPPQGGLQQPPTNAVPMNFVPNRPFTQPPQLHQMQHMQPQQQQARASDTTCYLLSGPQGPQALLFSPQHGTYTGAFTTGPTGLRPTPTTTAAGVVQQQQQQPNPQQQALAQLVQQAVGHPQNQNQQVAANPAAPQAQAQAGGDPNGPAQAIMNNIWLLFRVLIFVYFVMGSNLGWRRPAALAVIGIGFWMVRAGLFGEGGVARRWWEGVVRVGPVAVPNVAGEQGQAEVDRQGGEGDGVVGQGGQGAIPTPEEVARRLIEEQRNGRQQQWRESVRPVERAVALFVASLWPGIGEAHVRDQEREVQRVRDEAEVEARRREEEARKAEEEREKKAEEEKEKGEAASEKTARAATTGESESMAAQTESAAAAEQGEGSGSAAAEGT